MTHCLGQKKIRKILAVISVKWFYTVDITVKIKLGRFVQYEPENLNVNKVCFAK